MRTAAARLPLLILLTATGPLPGSSRSAPADSTGGAPPERVSAAIGGYQPVSDVDQHARMSLDVCAIDSLLATSPIDFAAVASIYRDGRHSTEGSGAKRTMGKFARGARAKEVTLGRYEKYYGAAWIDSFVVSALEGRGAFARASDTVRARAIAVGVRDQVLVAWAFHELDAAVAKAERGDLANATGAPHNWDEVRAYYHGVAPLCAAHRTAEERQGEFEGGLAVSDVIVGAMQRGLRALLDGDAISASRARDEVVRNVTLTYLRCVLHSAAAMDAALVQGRQDEARVRQAEAWAYYRVIEPLVAGADNMTARAVAKALDPSTSPARGSGEKASSALAKSYRALGVTAADVGRHRAH